MKQAVAELRKRIPTRVVPTFRYGSQVVPLDPQMTGNARFAVQVDTGVGSISSQLSVNTTKRVGTGDTMLVTSALPPGIVAGSLIDLDREEQAIVLQLQETIDTDGSTTWHWTLDHALVNAFPSGTQINFVAFPITSVADADVGATSLSVDSPLFLVPGDSVFSITKPSAVLVSSPMSEISAATQVVQVDQSVARWSITVAPLTYSVSVGDVLHVSASVAYRSARVPLGDLSGPYVADMMGGKTFGTGDDALKMSFEFFGGLSYSSTVQRNQVVMSLPIRVGDVSLWAAEHGSMRVRSYNHVEMLLDADGNFNIGYEMPITAPIVIDWIVNRGYGRVALLIDGVAVLDQTGSEDLRWSGNGRTVELRIAGNTKDVWSISTNPVRIGYRSVQYSYVAKTRSEEVWNGTCVMLKPLLKQLSDSNASDNNSSLIEVSSGGIIF